MINHSASLSTNSGEVGTVFAVTGSGTWSGGTWTLDNDGVLTISGSGEVTTIPWNNDTYRSSIQSVVIENGVTNIVHDAFYGCSSLSTITMPGSVTSIGARAFCLCSNLSAITIPSSVTSLDGGVFRGCSSLSTITIPSSVTSLGGNVFEGCSSLSTITIPSSVTSIGENAFAGCGSLSDVSLPGSIESIGINAFSDCASLQSINVNSNNNYYKSLDGVLFTKDGTELMQYPVGNTRTSYTVPDGVRAIDKFAFSKCTSLISVTIPGSVESIDGFAFYQCENLRTIVFEGENPPEIGYNTFFMYYDYDDADDYAFYSDIDTNNTQILVPEEYIDNYRYDSNWLSSSYVFDDYTDFCMADFVKVNTPGEPNTGVVADIVLPTMIISTLIGMLAYVGFSSKRKHRV